MDNFVRSSGLLDTTFSYFVRNAYVRESQLRTKFNPTSNKLRSNFEWTSSQLCANFGPTSCKVRKVRTSHGKIISAATVHKTATKLDCLIYFCSPFKKIINYSKKVDWKMKKLQNYVLLLIVFVSTTYIYNHIILRSSYIWNFQNNYSTAHSTYKYA